MNEQNSSTDETTVLAMVRDALQSTYDALRHAPMISTANTERRELRRLIHRAKRAGVQLAIDQVELMLVDSTPDPGDKDS